MRNEHSQHSRVSGPARAKQENAGTERLEQRDHCMELKEQLLLENVELEWNG